MAAKCNITRYALDSYNKLVWGINCTDNRKAIIENYIEYLDCPDVDLVICYPDNCNNEAIIFNCSLAIRRFQIDPDIDLPIIRLFIAAQDILNGIGPHTFLWQYDHSVFTALTEDNDQDILLQVNTGIDYTTLVSAITLTVVDANGCKAVKICNFTPAGMICKDQYLPCPNATLLVSVYNPVLCAKADSLLVTLT